MSHIADSDVYKSELERVSHYAQTKIDVILKDMLEKLFVATPEDPIDVNPYNNRFLHRHRHFNALMDVECSS